MCGSEAGCASRCQRVRRYARQHGMTVREADQYLRDWHAKRKGEDLAA